VRGRAQTLETRTGQPITCAAHHTSCPAAALRPLPREVASGSLSEARRRAPAVPTPQARSPTTPLPDSPAERVLSARCSRATRPARRIGHRSWRGSLCEGPLRLPDPTPVPSPPLPSPASAEGNRGRAGGGGPAAELETGGGDARRAVEPLPPSHYPLLGLESAGRRVATALQSPDPSASSRGGVTSRPAWPGRPSRQPAPWASDRAAPLTIIMVRILDIRRRLAGSPIAARVSPAKPRSRPPQPFPFAQPAQARSDGSCQAHRDRGSRSSEASRLEGPPGPTRQPTPERPGIRVAGGDLRAGQRHACQCMLDSDCWGCTGSGPSGRPRYPPRAPVWIVITGAVCAKPVARQPWTSAWHHHQAAMGRSDQHTTATTAPDPAESSDSVEWGLSG
jgi:hypothetical protein